MNPQEKAQHDAEVWKLTRWVLALWNVLVILLLMGAAAVLGWDRTNVLLGSLVYLALWDVELRTLASLRRPPRGPM